MTFKKCKDCQEAKPLDAYYKDDRMKDGHLNACKDCRKNYQAGRYNKKKKDREWLKAERARGREKALRLNYNEKYKEVNKSVRIAANKKWIERNPEKRAAHIKVGNAVRDGVLKKGACQVCGGEKVEAHHPDYRKPLEVIWLCRRHHAELHRVD